MQFFVRQNKNSYKSYSLNVQLQKSFGLTPFGPLHFFIKKKIDIEFNSLTNWVKFVIRFQENLILSNEEVRKFMDQNGLLPLFHKLSSKIPHV